MAVTTKTADLLASMALRLTAISDAVYETDRDAAAEINEAAKKLANAALVIERRLELYAKAAAHP